MDVDANPVAGAFDHHVGNAGPVKVFGQIVADFDIFRKIISIFFIGEPVGLPVGSNAQSEAVWVNFLAHYYAPAFWLSTTTVMWLVRLRIWNARP